MSLIEFLQLIKTIRMLYGLPFATEFFEKNVNLFPDLKDLDIAHLKKK